MIHWALLLPRLEIYYTESLHFFGQINARRIEFTL